MKKSLLLTACFYLTASNLFAANGQPNNDGFDIGNGHYVYIPANVDWADLAEQ